MNIDDTIEITLYTSEDRKLYVDNWTLRVYIFTIFRHREYTLSVFVRKGQNEVPIQLQERDVELYRP